MIGGYMSFSGFEGKAKYQNTALADVLPVTMLGYDDRIESPAGVTPVPVASHAVLRGIEGQWPPMLGYNRLIAKADATVVLEWERTHSGPREARVWTRRSIRARLHASLGKPGIHWLGLLRPVLEPARRLAFSWGRRRLDIERG